VQFFNYGIIVFLTELEKLDAGRTRFDFDHLSINIFVRDMGHCSRLCWL